MSSAVTGVQTESPNGNTLMVSWGPPENPNGDILNYSVSIINLNDGSIVQENMINANTNLCTKENSEDQMLLFTDAVPGVPYSVSIAAVNGAGIGELIVLVNFTQPLGIK